MNGNKKFLAMAVLCAVASVGFVLPAAAEETMTHDLEEVIVEADKDALPGGICQNQRQRRYSRYKRRYGCSLYTNEFYQTKYRRFRRT